MLQSKNQRVNHQVQKTETVVQDPKVQVPGKVVQDLKVDQVLPEKVALDLEVEGIKV